MQEVKNADEIELEMSDEEAPITKSKKNADEIDLDMSDEEAKEAAPVKADAGNPEEIPLDMDEDVVVPEVETKLQKETREDTEMIPAANPDEITLDDLEDDMPPAPIEATTTSSTRNHITGQHTATKFLALSKCLPARDFLQVSLSP